MNRYMMAMDECWCGLGHVQCLTTLTSCLNICKPIGFMQQGKLIDKPMSVLGITKNQSIN